MEEELTTRESIKEKLDDMKEDISSYKEELDNAINDYLEDKKRTLKNYQDQLEALSPMKVLNRGFSITQDENGKVITSVKDVKAGEVITTIVKDGTINSKVEKVEEK